LVRIVSDWEVWAIQGVRARRHNAIINLAAASVEPNQGREVELPFDLLNFMQFENLRQKLKERYWDWLRFSLFKSGMKTKTFE
jgi:hypothetical protein